jgi:lipopolysaccharide export system permease protein
VALFSSGVSLRRIMVPFVAVGLVMTAFMFWFNGWIVPRTNAVVIEFQGKYYKDAPAQAETSQIHRQNRPGSVLSVGFFDQNANQAYRVLLQDFEDADGSPGAERLARRLDASDMQWVDSLGVWRMRYVTLYTFGPDTTRRREIPQLDTTLQVLPRDLARTERDAERLTIPEAKEYIASLRRAGADRLGRPLVSYYGKFSYPVANFILVVIGLFVAFVYLALQKLSEPFGYAETVPPAVVAWVPHLLFAGFAAALLWRVNR